MEVGVSLYIAFWLRIEYINEASLGLFLDYLVQHQLKRNYSYSIYLSGHLALQLCNFWGRFHLLKGPRFLLCNHFGVDS